MGRGVLEKKNRSQHGKGSIIAHYCAIPPSQPPFIAYNIAQYIYFPHDPLYNNKKYWQYLVRAKAKALEDAGNAGAPLELLLNDRPDGLTHEQPWHP